MYVTAGRILYETSKIWCLQMTTELCCLVVNTTQLETNIHNLENHLNVIAQLLVYVS
jgi:hypothetical protein